MVTNLSANMNNITIQKVTGFLDSWLKYRARHSTLPGFTIAILANDKIIFSQSYGLANVETKEPLNNYHLFHVASQTKMLTAIAIMQLEEAGKLALNEPTSTYLPWLKQHSNRWFSRITIRHLLNHSAGIIRGEHDNDYWLFKKPYPTASQLREIILSTPLAFTPGSDVKYSNLGYGLLGLIIEQISGRSYARHITDTILKPLGLTQIALDYDSRKSSRIPVGYSRHNQAISPRRPLRSLAPAAGLYATSEAMCRFVSAMFSGNTTLIKDTTRQEMQQTHAKVNQGYNEGEEFGLGLLVHTVGKRRIIGHDGHVAGHMSATYFDPAEKIAVSICSNTKDAPVFAMISGVFGIIDFFAGTSKTESPFNVRLANEISTIQIVYDGKKFLAIDPDDWQPFAWYETLEQINDTTLRITTPGSIFNHAEPVEYTFLDGAVKSVRFAGITLKPER